MVAPIFEEHRSVALRRLLIGIGRSGCPRAPESNWRQDEKGEKPVPHNTGLPLKVLGLAKISHFYNFMSTTKFIRPKIAPRFDEVNPFRQDQVPFLEFVIDG
jgi:hypothetical protein